MSVSFILNVCRCLSIKEAITWQEIPVFFFFLLKYVEGSVLAGRALFLLSLYVFIYYYYFNSYLFLNSEPTEPTLLWPHRPTEVTLTLGLI